MFAVPSNNQFFAEFRSEARNGLFRDTRNSAKGASIFRGIFLERNFVGNPIPLIFILDRFPSSCELTSKAVVVVNNSAVLGSNPSSGISGWLCNLICNTIIVEHKKASLLLCFGTSFLT
jgi:hypothetical protein